MIELTTGYKSSQSPKLLLGKAHILYVCASTYTNPSYEGVNSYIEYGYSNEPQILYVKETYEQIKEMLK